MKKSHLFGCLIVLGIVIVLALFCAGISVFGGYKYFDSNIKITETLINNTLPGGYLVIYASKNEKLKHLKSSQPITFIVLSDSNLHTYVIYTGDPIKNDDDREMFFTEFKSGYVGGSNSDNIDIVENGTIEVDGNEYDLYSVSATIDGAPKEGLISILTFPSKTIFYLCTAEKEFFDEEHAKMLLQKIKESK